MKKGQIVEGIVERVDFPNKGTVIVEEKEENGEITKHRVEVKGVIPGQKVRLSIKKAGAELPSFIVPIWAENVNRSRILLRDDWVNLQLCF